MEKNKIKCAIADAIVMQLWLKDLITTEEKDRILLKNKSSFRTLLSKCLFERFVILSNNNGVGTLEGVFDENLNFLGV